MSRILLVEDDSDIRDILKTYLNMEKFIVIETDNLSDMKNIINNDKDIDLILLDIMLPDGESLDELPYIKSKLPDTGIIMISAKNTDKDKIYGIDSGADDYITKPFNPREVLSRVRSLLKRVKKDLEILKFNSLEIYPDSYIIKLNDKNIDLTSKEFEIVHMLAKKNERIYTRDEIIDRVWYGDEFITDRVIDVHISMIRSKLGKHWIKTIRNVGYKFNKNAYLIEDKNEGKL